MISAHFNGEIVRHRDMAIIQNRIKETNDNEHRCKYGVHFLSCDAWVNHLKERPEIKKLSEFGSCTMAGCELCPHYKKRKDQGNTKKVYSINWSIYRKISSAAHYMLKESEYKSVFVTLTFPPWKKEHKLTKSFYYDEISNILFSKYAENLRSNYNCSHYIAVKEYGERNGRLHFHLLVSLPFISFARLNDSWCNTLQDVCHYSDHAFQTDKKSSSIIKNPNRAVRYVCKYFNKSFGVQSGTRIVFISNSTLCRPVKIKEYTYNHIDYLKQFKSIQIKTYDHVTVFKVMDPKEFNKFCHKFLYPLFECSIKQTEFHYQTSESPPT